MLKHYLKVAFRNMRKYWNQTLVSVIGLAVGFTCFAMAALWIRYEMTFDSFHKNADRIYCISNDNIFSGTENSTRYVPSPLAGYLRSTFPEIANAVALSPYSIEAECEGVRHKVDFLGIDSSFFRMFDVKIVEGSTDFLIPESGKTAITREKALQMFGNESPFGKKICLTENYCKEICAIVTGFSKRSNYPFDFLLGIHADVQIRDENSRSYHSGYMLVETVSGIDMEAFEKKLNEHDFQQQSIECIEDIKNIKLTPLTAIRYKAPDIDRDVKFQHIIIFAVAGLLLILCTLFNYLTLFLSRFRMRQRELALRTVYGASGRSLFAMLSIEFLMSLTAALVSGLALINILCPFFLKLSGVRLELSAIYLESVIYIAGIVAVSLAVFFLTLVIFRRQTLNANIRNNKKILRKTSIAVQLIISIVFAFCTLVILKQMHYLHNTSDLGFSFKNRGSVYVPMMSSDQTDVLNDKVKQIPEIQETVAGYMPLLPVPLYIGNQIIYNWDGKQGGDENIDLQFLSLSEQYVKFYEFKLVEGDFLRDDDDKKYVLINESAAKAFGWHKSVGKSFGYNEYNDGYTVKGVIRNIYSFSPTIAVKPFYYFRSGTANMEILKFPTVLFKYKEGSWKTCMEKIGKIIEKEFPGQLPEYHNMEEEYDKYLKSENALLAILTVVSLVCLTVCVFGFVSMVSLTCEERRKEIAIRKINGATIKDILDIFFKEYLTLLAVGALIAFPIGYIIMKRWLENYVIQTEMSAWIYLSILLALITVIVLCVGGRVYKTSRENPVNAIK